MPFESGAASATLPRTAYPEPFTIVHWWVVITHVSSSSTARIIGLFAGLFMPTYSYNTEENTTSAHQIPSMPSTLWRAILIDLSVTFISVITFFVVFGACFWSTSFFCKILFKFYGMPRLPSCVRRVSMSTPSIIKTRKLWATMLSFNIFGVPFKSWASYVSFANVCLVPTMWSSFCRRVL